MVSGAIMVNRKSEPVLPVMTGRLKYHIRNTDSITIRLRCIKYGSTVIFGNRKSEPVLLVTTGR